MGQRLIDYALVAFVIAMVFGIFRISRILMNIFLKDLKRRFESFGDDHILVTAFITLLAGLLFLPSITAVLALINNQHLAGGMVLHLILVALSIILFSISEDLFREFSSPDNAVENWPRSRHNRLVVPALIVFWIIGTVFLSPIFYSGLTVILFIFYNFAVSCRRSKSTEDG